MSQNAPSLHTLSSSIEFYEKVLRQLLSRRKQIFQNLHWVLKQQNYFQREPCNTQIDNAKLQNGSKEHIASDDLSKLVKKEAVENPPENIVHKARNGQEIPSEDVDEFRKAVQVQASLLDRNKRLFGGISKHLMKARSRIQSDQHLKTKTELEEKIREKQKEKSQEMKEQKAQHLEKLLQKTIESRDENAKQILKYQNLILQTKYSSYVNQLQPFILTKTQPQLAWKPAKDSKLTRKLFANSKKELQADQTKIKEIIGSYSEIFNHAKFIHENQQEYCQNLLKKYFEQKSSFLITKTEPQLMWKPVKFNQKLKKLKEKSNELLAETKKKIQNELIISFANESYHDHHAGEHSESEEN